MLCAVCTCSTHKLGGLELNQILMGSLLLVVKITSREHVHILEQLFLSVVESMFTLISKTNIESMSHHVIATS